MRRLDRLQKRRTVRWLGVCAPMHGVTACDSSGQRHQLSSSPTSVHGARCLMEFFSDVGGDPLKPSLFELVAQEQLRDLLQPALKYVLSVSQLSNLRPRVDCAQLEDLRAVL